MNDFVNAFLLVYAGLFPIINPPGSAPLFLSLTRDRTDAERGVLASRIAKRSLISSGRRMHRPKPVVPFGELCLVFLAPKFRNGLAAEIGP
jgi:hypothetical protein